MANELIKLMYQARKTEDYRLKSPLFRPTNWEWKSGGSFEKEGLFQGFPPEIRTLIILAQG
jgi:hypothetical protein